MSRKHKVKIVVTVESPPGVNLQELVEYVRSAVNTMKKSREVSDPLFHLPTATARLARPSEKI